MYERGRTKVQLSADIRGESIDNHHDAIKVSAL